MSITEALRGDALLTAAFDSFARFGFRRTTMADVAGAAGMSRPALYLRVPNKEELLRQVAAAVLADSLTRARAAAADAGAPVAERVDGVLQAKLGMTLALAERSEHAVELLDQYHRLAAQETVEYQREVEELTASALAGTGAPPERCALLAAALTRAVIGLEHDPLAPDEARALLSALVGAVVDGLTAPAHQH